MTVEVIIIGGLMGAAYTVAFVWFIVKITGVNPRTGNYPKKRINNKDLNKLHQLITKRPQYDKA